MPTKKQMIGKRFGKLVVLKELEQRNSRKLICYLCKCDCGQEVKVCGRDLTRGSTRSCGCLQKEKAASRFHVHGNCGTRLYSIWKGMLSRCNSHSKHCYKHYGSRGITVCDEWKDFIKFKKWALSNGYKDNLTLDRIDVNGIYCPQNCRWLTMKEQSNNRTNNHYITYKGETKTVSQWADYFGLTYSAMSGRVLRGWSMERIEYTPPRQKRKG